MPSYSSIYRTLHSLADQEAEVTRLAGRDKTKWGILRLDNVQQYVKQRDMRIGRENAMRVGIAATYFEIPTELYVKGASDPGDKRERIAENKRKDLTAHQLLGWIDNQHLEKTLALHWLKVLTDSIPELDSYRHHVSTLFRTRVAKHPIPVRETKVHPLASNGKNETVTTELKDGLFDFFDQTGQTREDHDERLLMVGGDGLTYEKILQLKKYLQMHPGAFESLDLVEPQLEVWHDEATNLARLVETHWGGQLSSDPSTLGHSARHIGRAEPNLKKPDFYPTVQLVDTILDARMLDCWR